MGIDEIAILLSKKTSAGERKFTYHPSIYMDCDKAVIKKSQNNDNDSFQ
jgi:hypothetical protein